MTRWTKEERQAINNEMAALLAREGGRISKGKYTGGYICEQIPLLKNSRKNIARILQDMANRGVLAIERGPRGRIIMAVKQTWYETPPQPVHPRDRAKRQAEDVGGREAKRAIQEAEQQLPFPLARPAEGLAGLLARIDHVEVTAQVAMDAAAELRQIVEFLREMPADGELVSQLKTERDEARRQLVAANKELAALRRKVDPQ